MERSQQILNRFDCSDRPNGPWHILLWRHLQNPQPKEQCAEVIHDRTAVWERITSSAWKQARERHAMDVLSMRTEVKVTKHANIQTTGTRQVKGVCSKLAPTVPALLLSSSLGLLLWCDENLLIQYYYLTNVGIFAKTLQQKSGLSQAFDKMTRLEYMSLSVRPQNDKVVCTMNWRRLRIFPLPLAVSHREKLITHHSAEQSSRQVGMEQV